MSLPFLSVFDVLFAVFLALFPQATNLVHLNHMHSDGGVGSGEMKKKKKEERENESLPIYCWKSERPVTTTTLPALSGKEAASRATHTCD